MVARTLIVYICILYLINIIRSSCSILKLEVATFLLFTLKFSIFTFTPIPCNQLSSIHEIWNIKLYTFQIKYWLLNWNRHHITFLTCQYLYLCLCLRCCFNYKLTCLDVSSVMLLMSCLNLLVILAAPVWDSNKPGRAVRVFSTTSLISARQHRRADYETQTRPYMKTSALQQEKYL